MTKFKKLERDFDVDQDPIQYSRVEKENKEQFSINDVLALDLKDLEQMVFKLNKINASKQVQYVQLKI